MLVEIPISAAEADHFVSALSMTGRTIVTISFSFGEGISPRAHWLERESAMNHSKKLEFAYLLHFTFEM